MKNSNTKAFGQLFPKGHGKASGSLAMRVAATAIGAIIIAMLLGMALLATAPTDTAMNFNAGEILTLGAIAEVIVVGVLLAVAPYIMASVFIGRRIAQHLRKTSA